jgi:hypothetical protein
MTYKAFKVIVAKHSGWIEDGVARFPSVWHKEQFEKETAGK